MSKEKKKFKDSVVGKFLTKNIPDAVPHLLDALGNTIPGGGLIKSLVGHMLTPEQNKELENLLPEYEKEMFAMEIDDRKSARLRETDFAKALGHVDWFQYFTGLIGLSSFAFILYVLVYVTIPEANRDLFIHAIGMVEGVAVSIFAYYYGSSKGSADKTKILKG